MSAFVRDTDGDAYAGPHTVSEPLAASAVTGVQALSLPLAKRTFDVLFATAALLAIGPFLLLILLAIVIESWGNPFFRQERVGLGGRHFNMLKLRSMYPDAESRLEQLVQLNERTGPVFKIRDDPRRTRVGRILRATSLDELPQLINVICGDMSLVGPRPALPREVVHYTRDQARRLSVTPGLTGPSQVGGRADLAWEDTVRLDIEYVENWTFWGDLVIIFKTVEAVISLRGAY